MGLEARSGWRGAPHWLRKSIVVAWNTTWCAVRGHDRILEGISEIQDEAGTFACPHCRARLK